MRFTAQEEYGLRCMVQLARHEAKSPMTIHAIADAEKLTPAYVGKLMRVLRKSGLVDSLHGPVGGYRLPRPSAEISIGEILSVLGGRLFEPKYCERYPGMQPFCIHTSECSIRSLWAGLDLIIEQILRRTHLSDLVRSERTMAEWIREQMPLALEAAAQAAVNPGLPTAHAPLPVKTEIPR